MIESGKSIHTVANHVTDAARDAGYVIYDDKKPYDENHTRSSHKSQSTAKIASIKIIRVSKDG